MVHSPAAFFAAFYVCVIDADIAAHGTEIDVHMGTPLIHENEYLVDREGVFGRAIDVYSGTSSDEVIPFDDMEEDALCPMQFEVDRLRMLSRQSGPAQAFASIGSVAAGLMKSSEIEDDGNSSNNDVSAE